MALQIFRTTGFLPTLIIEPSLSQQTPKRHQIHFLHMVYLKGQC